MVTDRSAYRTVLRSLSSVLVSGTTFCVWKLADSRENKNDYRLVYTDMLANPASGGGREAPLGGVADHVDPRGCSRAVAGVGRKLLRTGRGQAGQGAGSGGRSRTRRRRAPAEPSGPRAPAACENFGCEGSHPRLGDCPAPMLGQACASRGW